MFGGEWVLKGGWGGEGLLGKIGTRGHGQDPCDDISSLNLNHVQYTIHLSYWATFTETTTDSSGLR